MSMCAYTYIYIYIYAAMQDSYTSSEAVGPSKAKHSVVSTLNVAAFNQDGKAYNAGMRLIHLQVGNLAGGFTQLAVPRP